MMNTSATAGRARAFTTLRRLSQPRAPLLEQCELCSLPIGAEHRHLLETAQRRIVCACDSCALRFEGVLEGRFQLIPRDTRPLPGLRVTDAEWESLALPINLVFFFHCSRTGKMIALYPSPAGATESLLPVAIWERMAAANPPLAGLQPDVEALLVNRVGDARQYYLAPIDVCYELVGVIRRHWRGLAGGEEAWREIAAFFARLEANRA